MPTFSDRVMRIAGAGAAAWDVHARAVADAVDDGGVIVLSVGDPDFDTPADVVEAAVSAPRDGDAHYAEIRGRRSLREAICGDSAGRATGPTRSASPRARGTRSSPPRRACCPPATRSSRSTRCT